MKKQLLKLTLSAFAIILGTSLSLAQACPEIYEVEGSYKIAVCSESPGAPAEELYMTINPSSGGLEWAALLPNDDPTQVWTIQDHVNPHGTGFVQITADLSSLGAGTWRLIVDKSTIADANDKEMTISVTPGEPIADDTNADYGFDQFQRRRTSGFGGPGNDALFAKPKGFSGGARYGVVPSAAGDAVLFDGGGIDGLRFIFIEALPASVNTFEANAFNINNPVNNQLTIKGATDKVNKISVFSVLGNKVLSKSINNQNGDINMNLSTLSTGLYIVEISGNNGERFTKKIVKE